MRGETVTRSGEEGARPFCPSEAAPLPRHGLDRISSRYVSPSERSHFCNMGYSAKMELQNKRGTNSSHSFESKMELGTHTREEEGEREFIPLATVEMVQGHAHVLLVGVLRHRRCIQVAFRYILSGKTLP